MIFKKKRYEAIRYLNRKFYIYFRANKQISVQYKMTNFVYLSYFIVNILDMIIYIAKCIFLCKYRALIDETNISSVVETNGV